MSLARWNTKKPQSVRGAGLMTSHPISHKDDDNDDDDDHHASTSAITLERSIRESSIDSNAIDDHDFSPILSESTTPAPNSKQHKRKSTTKAPPQKKAKKTASKAKVDLFTTTLPWPEHLLKLEKTFKALNTVYTFCSARKSMATTFETLKGGVENLLRRPLQIHDIAQIKSLLPNLVSFAYIDSELLRIHAAGGGEESANRRKEKARELDEAYASASGKGKGKKDEEDETVLLFNFNDGELKAANGVGKVVNRRFAKKKKLNPEEPLKPPETVPRFTTESMTTLITKRNNKFSSAVAELLVACEAASPPQDPVALLLEATEDNLPVRPEMGEEGRKVGERKDDLEFYRRNPDKRLSVERILEEIREGEEYREQIVEGGHRVFEAREPVYGALDEPLSTAILDALYSTKSITQLFAHQSLAINYLSSGTQSVIISTSTSSGKSLIYQLPVLKALERDEQSTALYVFPTKALAQDQKRALGELVGAMEGLEEVKIATFDGDTPKEDRDYIRDNANVIFTNPDMLHLTILPREDTWRRFFQNLKFVVVDELHYYAGLFGCHVAFVMRRLRRICAAVGNRKVQFVSCSATIANPAEHMRAIFGVDDVQVVDVDGSPSGRKEYIVWNPPFIDDRDVRQGRISTITETSRIFRFLMDRGIRAIVFCKVRKQCEILMKQVRTDLMVEGRADMASRVMAYRSGYSAADRRRIEQEMFSGQLLGVIATTALELGIDIGSLDAVITVGFPYTLPGLRQQAGRAGRRNKDSLAMLICDPFPLDQHYARNPSLIFDSPYNHLSLDLDNPIVLEAHIQCAADEMPVHPEDDLVYFGPSLPSICQSRLIYDDETGFYHCHPRYKPYPSKHVPIRNTEDEKYDVVDISHGRNRIIEEIEHSRAIFTVYEGAVFMHQGKTYLVKEVNHDRRIAKIEQATIDWMTRQRDFTNVDAIDPLAMREVEGGITTAYYGTVKITSVVFGYFKTDRRNNILDTVDLSCPPFVRQSHGLWLDVPLFALSILVSKNIHPAGSIHAAEHALMSLTPIVAMCAEGDVRTECKQPEKELQGKESSRKRPPRLILYDSSGKSGGICAKAFDHISVLLNQAVNTIDNCSCLEGCPSCVASTICSGGNTIVSKIGASVVLNAILNRPIDVDAIPMQDPLHANTGVAGGTIDLRGVSMMVEDVDEDELRERERALDELIGSGRREPARLEEEVVEEMEVPDEEEEDEERENALAELFGKERSPTKTTEPETQVDVEVAVAVRRLEDSGGFLRL